MRTTTALLLLAACSGISDKDGDSGDGGALTEESFMDQYAERYCVEWAACNTSAECPVSTGETSTGTVAQTWECDFDPVAAAACLDGVWTCNVDFPGLEFVAPAQVCLTVCGEDRSTPTTTTTSAP
jgi:hypothetical protein